MVVHVIPQPEPDEPLDDVVLPNEQVDPHENQLMFQDYFDEDNGPYVRPLTVEEIQ